MVLRSQWTVQHNNDSVVRRVKDNSSVKVGYLNNGDATADVTFILGVGRVPVWEEGLS